MNQPKEPGDPKRLRSGFSRRGFIRGVGIGSGALGGAVLHEEALAEPPAAAAGVAGPGAVSITLQVNGKPQALNVEPRVTLLDALRNHLNLTGAKKVCDRGTCGACTVIMAGKVVYACNVLAIDAQGKNIQTIESLSTGSRLHPVEAAFVRHDAQQCGYCTPGFVMAAKNFLDKNPNPTMQQIEHGLSGNLCRCGTYVGMRQAVLEASKAMKGGPRA
ncbi:MAG: (2Fe-2S)-binding protein [Bryobacterales bacterium]|nr:(2Fe-2S)-binding protein [Bryobacterales bacterium]